jgi:hypothetical protein
MAVDGGICGERRADVLELGLLLGLRDGNPATLPGGDTLLQGDVVEPPAQQQHALQFPLLGGSGHEFVLTDLCVEA